MIARSYALETQSAFLRLARLPGYVVPTIAFPLMFYAFFGLALNRHETTGSVADAVYLIGSYGTFGVIGAALFGVGTSIANDRAEGLLLLKRASPMPPFAFLLAKIATAAAFGAIITTLLLALGIAFGNVPFAPATDLAVLAILTVGSIPFAAIGLAVGALATPSGAPALINCLYLPMSFASGLWVPIAFLPVFVQRLAPWFPAYHLAQLARMPFGVADGSVATHLVVIVAYTSLGLSLAAFGLRRDESRAHG
jgi:ABC-2 type transport system permease protein